MSDFESRLTAALAEGAEDAPGAVGLAHGARRRAAVRRRRRVSVVSVAAVLAVLVPLGVVRGLAGDEGARVVTDAPGGWKTVTVADVSVDVPPGWRSVMCGPVTNLLPQDDTCATEGPRVTVVDQDSIVDVLPGLGETSGAVLAADQIVSVRGESFETMRRILASARPVGTDAPDVTTWRTQQLEYGVTVVVPDDPAVRATVSGAVPSCTGTRAFARPTSGGRWTVAICTDRIVIVTAPTRALADLVALSVGDAEVSDRLRVVTVGRAEVAIPADWVERPGCTGPGDQPAYGPPGGDESCATIPGAFEVPASFTLADDDGITTCPTAGGCAYRRVGDGGVLTRGLDRSLVEQVYDSIGASD